MRKRSARSRGEKAEALRTAGVKKVYVRNESQACIFPVYLSRDNSIELYAMETRSSSSYGESNRHCGGRAFLFSFLFSSNVSIIGSVRDLESGGSFNFLNFESSSWGKVP